MQVLLGKAGTTDVYWSPTLEFNWNFAVVGGAGTGKTQTVKAILQALASQGLPYLVLDFKPDYSHQGQTTSDFGTVINLTQTSINPLELDGRNSPRDQKFQGASIIDLTYDIGPLQQNYIVDAAELSYQERGIDEDDPTTWSRPAPNFADLERLLVRMADNGSASARTTIQGVLARLRPIFDYRVFGADTQIPFHELVSGRSIIHLAGLATDGLKAVVSEFLLRKLRYHLYTMPDSLTPKLFIVIDEAHRPNYDHEASDGQLLKEARSKGVGLLLATQDPPDLTDVVYANTGGLLSLAINEEGFAKSTAAQLGEASHGKRSRTT